jgi:hypothetical protein
MEGSQSILATGRVGGVREGNVYAIYPFDSGADDSRPQIATAFVTKVNGFKSLVHLEFTGEVKCIPDEGAKAVLQQEALYEWPIELSAENQGLQLLVNQSSYLRPRDADDKTSLGKIKQKDHLIELVNSRGDLIAARRAEDHDSFAQILENTVTDAEELARGQHLLSLYCESPGERLQHQIKIRVGLVIGGQRGRTIRQDGTDYMTEGDHVYINLQNEGKSDNTVYISVFDVNVAGRVSYLSASSPMGIDLERGRCYTLGELSFNCLEGLPVTWPERVPRSQQVEERLVAVITSSPVDLGHLGIPAEEKGDRRSGKTANTQSNFEQLIDQISSARCRTIQPTPRAVSIRYDVIQIPFSLKSSDTDSGGP